MSVGRSGVSEVRDLYYDTIEILGVASDVTNVFLQQTRPGDWRYNFTYNRADQVTVITFAVQVICVIVITVAVQVICVIVITVVIVTM